MLSRRLFASRPLSRGILLGCANRIAPFSSSRRLLADSDSDGSLFGQVTKKNEGGQSFFGQVASASEVADKKAGTEDSSSTKLPASDKQLRNDPEIRALTHPAAKRAPQLLLSPLKRRLYELSMEQGGYDPKQVLHLHGKEYQLHLTKEEQKALEPSLYLKSFRIKSSTKKATPFLRMLRGLGLEQAITQCHFSPKHIARDVAEMFTRGVGEARQLKLNVDDLYIAQIWVGKDGGNYKRLDFKGRGRAGIIEHKWVHVRAILQPVSVKHKFEQDKRTREMSRRVKSQLVSKPIHEFPKGNVYKW